MKSFKMAMPKTLEGAVKVLGFDFEERQVLAGGTDLLACVKEHIAEPEVVVNLKGIPHLTDVIKTETGVEIGALVKLDELANNKDIQQRWPALAQSIAKTATPQIRNVGTVGGNLCQRPRCWYYRDESYDCSKKGGSTCYALEGENEYHAIFETGLCQIVHPSNMAGPLIAYDAKAEIQSPQGTRQVQLEKFFISPETNINRENILKPNEILTKIFIPNASANKNSCYYETREKQSFDWALCGTSVSIRLNGKMIQEARIVLNAVAPRPIRRHDLEAALKGKKVSKTLFKKVAEMAVQGATPLSKNSYKIELLKVVVERCLAEAAEA